MLSSLRLLSRGDTWPSAAVRVDRLRDGFIVISIFRLSNTSGRRYTEMTNCRCTDANGVSITRVHGGLECHAVNGEEK